MKLEVIGITKENNILVSRDSLKKYLKDIYWEIEYYKEKIAALQKALRDKQGTEKGNYEK